MNNEDMYSLREFLLSHKISKGTFYKLLKANRAPKIIKLDGKILITKKAAQEWRDKMES